MAEQLPVSIKNKQNYFCYNYGKLSPNLIIFGTKMSNSLKLYKVHSISLIALETNNPWGNVTKKSQNSEA